MALLQSIKTKIIAVITTTMESPTFCELLNAINNHVTDLTNTVSELQGVINTISDSFKVKSSVDDTCAGYLMDKFVDSDTITIQEVDDDGCKTIKLNVKPVTTTSTTIVGLTESACKTIWTSVLAANYGTWTHAVNTAWSMPWQGSVQWMIDKYGKLNIRGRAQLINKWIPYLSDGTAPANEWSFDQKVFSLPSGNTCLDAIAAEIPNDYYGCVYIATLRNTKGGNVKQWNGRIAFDLYRTGLDFYVKVRPLDEEQGEGFYDVFIDFGQLKSIN